ncbi:MAG: O-antigen ligase family protein, partial [Actinobacteria bacterium]|nr:O-antigen ligase family protein [Actinomycetota bacterium]
MRGQDTGERFAELERDTYSAYLSSVEPVRLNRVTWVAISIAVGIVLGRVAAAPDQELGPLLLGTGVALFTGLAVLRPYRAVQLFLIASFSGFANLISLNLPAATFVGGGIPLVALLGFGWLVGGAHLPDSGVRRYALPLLMILLMLVAAELVGSARDTLWVNAQGDLIPALALVAFIPMIAVMRSERELRGVMLATAVGLALLALRVLFTYIANLDAPPAEVTTTYVRILGEQGLAGGPRVLPSYHAGALFPLGFVAAVMAARVRRGSGLAAPLSLLLAALFVLAMLVMYSRSLLLTGVIAFVLAVAILNRDPRRALRAVLWVGMVAIGLSLVIPLITGGPVGSVVSGLRERFTDIGEDLSYTNRVAEDREAIKAFATSPIIGLGLGADVFVAQQRAGLPGYFHDAYLGFLVKTGIVGTAVWVGVVGMVLIRAGRAALRSTGFEAAMLAAGTAWLFGLMVA